MDSFIDKMVQSLSEEMKQKRKDILKDRKGLKIFLFTTKKNYISSFFSYFHAAAVMPNGIQSILFSSH